MPYFFVVPAFVLAALAMSAASILCAAVPRWRGAFPFAWRILLWSSVGCIVANIPMFGLYLVPLGLQRAGVTPDMAADNTALRIVFVACLLIGPFVASAAGYLGGVFIGVRLAARAKKEHGRSQQV
jgi:hypothetical protein